MLRGKKRFWLLNACVSSRTSYVRENLQLKKFTNVQKVLQPQLSFFSLFFTAHFTLLACGLFASGNVTLVHNLQKKPDKFLLLPSGGAAWGVVGLGSKRVDMEILPGVEEAAQAALVRLLYELLISPTNALATPTSELFSQPRPHRRDPPADWTNSTTDLHWKQRRRRVNKARHLTGAALFSSDFYFFFNLF